MDTLIKLNKFSGIVFHEDEHIYKYNGLDCISVTTLIKEYSYPFDENMIASAYAKKHDLELLDVLKNWEDIRTKASLIGSEVHKYAEMKFLQKAYVPNVLYYDTPFKVLSMVDNFYNDTIDKLIPVKLEFVIGDIEKRVCGMIDKLFYNVRAQELQIWDYKTNKKIDKYSVFKNRMRNGLEHLHDCEFNKYSLQLAIYKKIIEKNCQIKLGNSYICWLNDSNENYQIIKTADMTEEVNLIWDRL